MNVSTYRQSLQILTSNYSVKKLPSQLYDIPGLQLTATLLLYCCITKWNSHCSTDQKPNQRASLDIHRLQTHYPVTELCPGFTCLMCESLFPLASQQYISPPQSDHHSPGPHGPYMWRWPQSPLPAGQHALPSWGTPLSCPAPVGPWDTSSGQTRAAAGLLWLHPPWLVSTTVIWSPNKKV